MTTPCGFTAWLDSLSDCAYLTLFLMAWVVVGLLNYVISRRVDEERYLLEEAAALQETNRERERVGLPILYDARVDQYHRRRKGN